MTLDLIEQFLATGRVGKEFTPSTKRAYRNDLTDYATTIGPERLLSVEPQEVKTYIRKGRWTDSTRVRKVAALHSFYRWCTRRGQIDSSPVRSVRMKYTPPIPHATSTHDIETLLVSMDRLRDKTIIAIFAGCGLKIHEATALNIENILLHDTTPTTNPQTYTGTPDSPRMAPTYTATITINNKTRKVPVPHYLGTLLAQYLQEHTGTGPLLLNKHRTRLGPRGIRRAIQKKEVRTNAEQLRNAYMTWLREQRLDTNAPEILNMHPEHIRGKYARLKKA